MQVSTTILVLAVTWQHSSVFYRYLGSESVESGERKVTWHQGVLVGIVVLFLQDNDFAILMDDGRDDAKLSEVFFFDLFGFFHFAPVRKGSLTFSCEHFHAGTVDVDDNPMSLETSLVSHQISLKPVCAAFQWCFFTTVLA